MAIIDEDIPVKYGDGTLYFEDPGERSKLLLSVISKGVKEDEKDVDEEELRPLLWGQLRKVENLKRLDGTEVTLESIRDGEDGKRRRFFQVVLRNYIMALAKAMNGEDAEAKNE